MKVKAMISFAGAVSMRQGEERDIPNGSDILKDLLKAGYVKEIKTARRGKNDENKPGDG